MKLIQKLARLAVCGAVLLGLLATSALAEEFRPSITASGAPDILSAVDAEGKDVRDYLVITPYPRRQEMQQSYKIELFERSYNALDLNQFRAAMRPTLSEGMREENLLLESLYYIHEAGDSDYIVLPVTVTLGTSVPMGRYCEMMAYWENSRIRTAPHSGDLAAPRSWTHAKTSRDASGMTITLEVYGPYATVLYRTQESGTSPQTGESETAALAAAALLLAAAAAAKKRRTGHSA